MPATVGDLVEFMKLPGFSSLTSPVVLLEQVGGFRKGNPSPGSAMFKFGRNYGNCEAIAQCLSYRLQLITPQKWQKAVGINPIPKEKPSDHKNRLKALAQRLFPETKVTLKNCDALLMTEAAKNLGLIES